jgi:hypothetical protein
VVHRGVLYWGLTVLPDHTYEDHSLCYCDLFFGLYPSSLCFIITFRGKSHPSKCCDYKTETMDKVQGIDNSNTAPSSKTFRDELIMFVKSLQCVKTIIWIIRSFVICSYPDIIHIFLRVFSSFFLSCICDDL